MNGSQSNVLTRIAVQMCVCGAFGLNEIGKPSQKQSEVKERLQESEIKRRKKRKVSACAAATNTAGVSSSDKTFSFLLSSLRLPSLLLSPFYLLPSSPASLSSSCPPFILVFLFIASLVFFAILHPLPCYYYQPHNSRCVIIMILLCFGNMDKILIIN